MADTDNLNLNVNPARADKFYLTIGNIPSSILLTPKELTVFQTDQLINQEKNFFYLGIKSLELPGLSLSDEKIDTMFNSVAETNNKYTFDPLTTEIKIDDNFLIYKMLFLWLFLINRPDEFNQFASGETFEKTSVTAILTITDSFNNPTITFEFYDLRPIAIPNIPLSFTNEGEELTMNITWQYTYFMPRKINGDAYSLNI